MSAINTVRTASPALPFDEQMEDQNNEDFFKNVSPKKSARKRRVGGGGSGRAQEQRPTIQRMNEQSLEKYKVFEKWQQEQEDDNITAKGDIESEQEAKEEPLSEDIYSLIYTANICSQAFYFAIFVFGIQQTLLMLIVFDLVDVKWSRDGGNPLRLPPGVPLRVNVAQAISMILVVVTILGDSGDLAHGLGNLVAGYDRDVLAKNPHASCCKWFTAFSLQTLGGLLMTLVLFLLVMQSTTVVGLALNFAALSFVYQIDNITFEMAKHGFLTRKIRTACERVQDLGVPQKQARRQYKLRKFLVVLMVIGLFVPYGYLVHNQWDSQYVCSKLFVQLSGEAIPDMVYYTGHFDVHKREDEIFGALRSRIDDRVHYTNQPVNATATLVLAYCAREVAWTISLNTTNHCSYLYKSSTTTSFDVTAVADLTWYAWEFKAARALPVQLYLRCDDCVGGSRGNCHSNNGECQQNQCVCKEGRMGVNCEQAFPACNRLRIDQRTNELPHAEGVSFSDDYQILSNPETREPYKVQHRPVYAASYYDTPDIVNATGQNIIGMDFMFFNGRRWVIIGRNFEDTIALLNPRQRSRRASDSGDGDTDAFEAIKELFGTANQFPLTVLSLVFPLKVVLAEILGANYSTENFPLYRPYFYSAAIDPLSGDDYLSPDGLEWYAANRPTSVISPWRPDTNRPLMSIFFCAECEKVNNPCMNDGFCNTNAVCECGPLFRGSMCEQPVKCQHHGRCLNNGTCEEWHDFCTCPHGFFGSFCQYFATSKGGYIFEP